VRVQTASVCACVRACVRTCVRACVVHLCLVHDFSICASYSLDGGQISVGKNDTLIIVLCIMCIAMVTWASCVRVLYIDDVVHLPSFLL
jgi:hypothetical protein